MIESPRHSPKARTHKTLEVDAEVHRVDVAAPPWLKGKKTAEPPLAAHKSTLVAPSNGVISHVESVIDQRVAVRSCLTCFYGIFTDLGPLKLLTDDVDVGRLARLAA
jgi:hypothetical protein